MEGAGIWIWAVGSLHIAVSTSFKVCTFSFLSCACFDPNSPKLLAAHGRFAPQPHQVTSAGPQVSRIVIRPGLQMDTTTKWHHSEWVPTSPKMIPTTTTMNIPHVASLKRFLQCSSLVQAELIGRPHEGGLANSNFHASQPSDKKLESWSLPGYAYPTSRKWREAGRRLLPDLLRQPQSLL